MHSARLLVGAMCVDSDLDVTFVRMSQVSLRTSSASLIDVKEVVTTDEDDSGICAGH